MYIYIEMYMYIYIHIHMCVCVCVCFVCCSFFFSGWGRKPPRGIVARPCFWAVTAEWQRVVGGGGGTWSNIPLHLKPHNPRRRSSDPLPSFSVSLCLFVCFDTLQIEQLRLLRELQRPAAYLYPRSSQPSPASVKLSTLN